MYKSFQLRSILMPVSKQIWSKLLSTSETSTALRPFFFVVHPDLFGKYPKERATNENSLKLLNEYLNALHGKGKPSSLTLTFYVRERAKVDAAAFEEVPDYIRQVQIHLLSQNVKDIVHNVLKTCDLSVDYVNSLPTSTPKNVKGDGNRPIKWDQSYYSFYNIRNPDEAQKKRKVIDTLSSWLHRNVPKARKKLAANEPIRQETARLSLQLQEVVGLTDVRWESGWSLMQFRACLKRLLQLYNQNKKTLHSNLSGHSLILGNDSGISIQGNIVLRHDEVQDDWLKVIQAAKNQAALLEKLPSAEKELSSLLNDIFIVRREYPVILAKEYLVQLKRMTGAIRKFYVEEPHQRLETSLADIQMIVESAQGPLTLSPGGHILVPSSCPGFLIIDFLSENHNKAKIALQKAKQNKEELEDLTQECKVSLGVASLSREPNITNEQFKRCCEHLMENPTNIAVPLENLHLKVAAFYSVMSDGEICIPWNWVGVCDT